MTARDGPDPEIRRGPRARSDIESPKAIRVQGERGNRVSPGELVRVEEVIEDKSIYHKNLMPVVYVTGDAGGTAESPVYVILNMMEAVRALSLPEGYGVAQYSTGQPFSSERLALKWDGEWFITYEVFRDLGLAVAAVPVLIFILVVGWFQSMKSPPRRFPA